MSENAVAVNHKVKSVEEKPYDDFVFGKYTTLRNYIRKADLFLSLQAIWAHCNHQQLKNFELPKFITGEPPKYRSAGSQEVVLQYGLAPWELEIIARELLIHAPVIGGSKNFCIWDHLSGAVNKLKSLENDIGGRYITVENVLNETKRISHRQFPWQQIPNLNKMIRYWKIYSKLSSHFEGVFSVSFSHFYAITMSLFGTFTHQFALTYPPRVELGSINMDTLVLVLQLVSLDYLDIKQKLKSELSMFHDYVYAYNSLIGYPLIKIDFGNKTYLTCPLPTLFLNRITDGVYYNLIDDRNINADKIKNDLGSAFQSYVGEYITATTESTLRLLPEQRYGSSHHRKDTVDWVAIDHNNDALFIECKSKRMTTLAKAELDDGGQLDNDLSLLAEAIKQAYERLLDYQNGMYPSLFVKTRRQFIVIATLEEWYLFGDFLNVRLNELVKEKLIQAKIDLSILEKSPFFIASTSTIEQLSHILAKHKIEDIFDELVVDRDKRLWHIDTYILKKYRELLNNSNNPFDREFNEFVENTIRGLQVPT